MPDDPAQPVEGQGGDTASSPYSEYLDKIPEDVRPQVEPVFKEWDGNVTKRFQEHAEYRKGWEPLEQTGVRDLSADEVAWLVQFRGALNDPQQIQAWYDDYAQQNGLTPAQAQQAQEDLQSYDPDVQAAIQRALEQQLGPISQQLGDLAQWQQQQQQQAAEQAARESIDQQIQALESKHGAFPRDQVEKFLGQYIQTDPEHAVERAHQDWLNLVASIEKQTLAQKLGQPPAAEGGGMPATAPETATNLKQAGEMAKAQLREVARRAVS